MTTDAKRDEAAGSPGVITEVAGNGNGATSAAAGSDRLKVLLVDDHVPVLRFLSLAFSSKGCDVITAGTAEEALELIGKQPCDLVVSDIKMPGLSGLDVLQAIKGRQPETPVVLITGAPTVDTAVFGLRHQAFDYLTKPFSADEVPQLIERVRRDRESRRRQEQHPAATVLTEELARRQTGVEGLSQIGVIALQGLDTAVFAEKVLELALESLGVRAAVITLCDEEGHLTSSLKGDPGLAARLATLSRSALGAPDKLSEDHTVVLSGPQDPFVAVGAPIPGPDKLLGMFCLGRPETRELLSDELQLVVAYARTIGLSVQRIVLRESVEQNLIDTISSFVNALESKDVYLKGHSARVSLYAGEIAKSMGLSRTQVAIARRVGILHDLGKIVVMDSILQKPGRLTPEEFALMKSHPLNAAKILKPLRFLSEEIEGIKRHHERFDGKGYPDGLKGTDIPLSARIVTAADSFDAMTSQRPYRDALPLDAALAELGRHTGAQFDPAVIEAFARVPLAQLAAINRFENAAAPPAGELTGTNGAGRPAGVAQ
jgi:putative nucleotidyltransferase with HDIG domain